MRSIGIFMLISVVLLFSDLYAAIPGPQLSIEKNGQLRFGDLNLFMGHYSEHWTEYRNNHNWNNLSAQELPRDGKAFSGTTSVSGVQAEVRLRLQPETKNRLNVDYHMKCATPAVFGAVFASLEFPVESSIAVFVNGRQWRLPKLPENHWVAAENELQELRFEFPSGYSLTVTPAEPVRATLYDSRKYRKEHFSIRIDAVPGGGTMTETRLKLLLTSAEINQLPVPLDQVANRAYCDSAASAGWTGQGEKNDMRSFTAESVRFGALKFISTSGRKAVVLAGQKRGDIPDSVELTLPDNQAAAVNLLHNCAWPPQFGETLGSILAEYPDGTKASVPVKYGSDCANWWTPRDRHNAKIAWQGENPSAKIGWYASGFTLPRKGAKKLTLKMANDFSMWMIAGITLSDHPVAMNLHREVKITTEENQAWLKLDYSRKISKTSPLNFSGFNHFPAGKYGRIIGDSDGTLEFQNRRGEKVRLYGVNLCQSANFPSREEADRLVEYLAYCGYNSVRFHHFDQMLIRKDAADSLSIDPEQLDRLDYLAAEFKKRGFYWTIDLFSQRRLRTGDGIDNFDEISLKNLLPIDEKAMANWQEFARKFLLHRNPYTALTWGEDPALFCINLVNEDTLTYNWNGSMKSANHYRQEFKRRNPDGDSDDEKQFRKFLHELQEETLAKEYAFVKNELKIDALLTSLNFNSEASLTLLRDRLDLVDNHQYFDHPAFQERQWHLPFAHQQKSAITELAEVPRRIMPTRIFGKPFIVTEFNYTFPNRFRAEGGPLIGAYASLQDWSAMYRFAWAHDRNAIAGIPGIRDFDAACDPLAQLADRLVIAMFRERMVKPSQKKLFFEVPADPFARGLLHQVPEEFQRLGLLAAIGSLPEGSNAGDGPVKYDGNWKDETLRHMADDLAKMKIARSETGEITLDATARRFQVVTPRLESITLPDGGATGHVLSLENASTFQTFAAISLDGKELRESGSVLMIHLTDVTNTGMKTNEAGTVLYENGKAPLLLKRGSVKVGWKTVSPVTVTALNADGEARGEVRGRLANGIFRFTADTGMLPGGIMAYHLIRTSDIEK